MVDVTSLRIDMGCCGQILMQETFDICQVAGHDAYVQFRNHVNK